MKNRNYKLMNTTVDNFLSKNQIIDILKSNRNLVEDKLPVGKLKDIDKAVCSIVKVKENNLKVLIVGDYDVDGVISTYELVKSLRDFGLVVDYVIPDRLNEGYGINTKIVRDAYDKGYKLILTCDNGIAADCYENVKLLDIEFIVTDHHNPKEDNDGNQIIPKVNSVINPKQNDCSYKYKNICGAVVVLELIKELMGEEYIDKSDFIELCALATICDVVELNGKNREIVIEGLHRMMSTSNIGLKTLIDKLLPDVKEISVYNCGFTLGPCINASGRLESALISLEMLLCEDEVKVGYYVDKLKSINEDRKLLTSDGLKEALELYEEDRLIQLIKLDSKYEPVSGIIAGRIKEKYNKPTMVCCFNETKGLYKGSGRSTEYYNMFDEISKSSKYLEKFGGHPMAIGFSILDGDIDSFKLDIEEKQKCNNYDIRKNVEIDMSLGSELIDEELIDMMELLGPFGSGNRKPQFIDQCILKSVKRVGKENNVMQFTFNKGKRNMYGVNFNDADNIEKYIKSIHGISKYNEICAGNYEVPVKIIYSPMINEYNGKRYIKLLIENIM